MRGFSVTIVASRGLESASRRLPLSLCLDSLLAQTYPRSLYEVIVVDSGSGLTAGFFEDYRHRGLTNLLFLGPNTVNIGPARGRNLGIRSARFDFIALTDDDSQVPPDWLDKFDQAYEHYPQAVSVGGLTLPPEVVSQKNIWAYFEKKLYWNYLKNGRFEEYISYRRDEHPVFAGNISYVKSALLKAGLFDESFPAYLSGEDGDLKERLLQGGSIFVFVPVVVVHRSSYDRRRFWRQQLSRGAAILRFRRRHHLETGRALIVLRFLISFLAWPYLIFKERDLRFSLVAWLSLLARNWGKLIYYEKV